MFSVFEAIYKQRGILERRVTPMRYVSAFSSNAGSRVSMLMDGSVPGKRRTFKWPREARDLVRDYLLMGGERYKLITALAKISGHPRDACLRFARELGVTARRFYREWSPKEIEELVQLCGASSVRLIALKLKRPETAIWGMLHRLGITVQIRKDSFTKYVLASLLHVRPQLIQRWVDKGLLPAHLEGTAKLPRLIITADDFVEFCKKHPAALLKGRVSKERIEFVFKFVFPPSHVHLLDVREDMKERAAYETQMEAECEPLGDDGNSHYLEDGGSSAERTA